MLVDVRTSAEWKWVGVPDLTELGRDVVYVEWVRSTGERNGEFLEELAAAGVTGPSQG